MADYSEYKTLDSSVLSGSLATVVNIMKTTVGIGIIGLPAAANDAGYMNFSFLVVSVAILSYYSIFLLTELGEVLEVDSYEDITRKVFQIRFKAGTFGLRLASLIIFMS